MLLLLLSFEKFSLKTGLLVEELKNVSVFTVFETGGTDTDTCDEAGVVIISASLFTSLEMAGVEFGNGFGLVLDLDLDLDLALGLELGLELELEFKFGFRLGFRFGFKFEFKFGFKLGLELELG